MNPQDQQDILKRLKALEDSISNLEDRVSVPSHSHNGFDSNQIAWSDLYQKKIWIRMTLFGTQAATSGNYGVFFIVPTKCLVTAIQEVHQVLGTDAGAVTLNIEKLTGTTAPGGGSNILSTAFDLKASINTVRSGTLTTTSSIKTLATGDRLSLLLTGTPTSVSGVTVHIELTF